VTYKTQEELQESAKTNLVDGFVYVYNVDSWRVHFPKAINLTHPTLQKIKPEKFEDVVSN